MKKSIIYNPLPMQHGERRTAVFPDGTVAGFDPAKPGSDKSVEMVVQLGPDGITEVPMSDYKYTTLHEGELHTMQPPVPLNQHIIQHYNRSIGAFVTHHNLKSRQTVYNWIAEGAMWWNDDVWTNKKLHNV